MRLLVDAIVQRTADIRSFVLVHPDGRPLPEFTAGAHLDVVVQLPAGAAERRSYSLVNLPDSRDHYEIAVLHQRSGRGGSAWMHDSVKVGDQLEVQGPRNAFALAEDADHHVLIAGGIGITPILCMARVLSQRGASAELHYFGREASALAFREDCKNLRGVSLHEFCSANTESVAEKIRDLTRDPQPGKHVYVCGPSGMIQTCLEAAASHSWPASAVHFERFGAASAVGDAAFSVELIMSGERFDVAAGQSLLDALLERGIDAPHDCRAGICGTCLVPVASGDVEHRDSFLSEQDRQDGGLMCACVSRARGPLRLGL